MSTKTIYVSAATGKEVSERFRKANPDKVIRKRVKVVTEAAAPKKSAVKKVASKSGSKTAPKTAPASYIYISKQTKKEVSERYAKANPTKVTRKRVSAPTPAPKSVAPKLIAPKIRSGIEKAVKKVAEKVSRKPAAKKPSNILGGVHQFVNGLESTGTYLIVAKAGDARLGFRHINGQVRMHAMPTFKSLGLKMINFTTRSAGRCDTAPYETVWENPNVARQILRDLLGVEGVKVREEKDVATALSFP